VHDDDFDRRRSGRQAEHGEALDRARVPGRQTLVEAEQSPADAAGVPGKRTLAQGLDSRTDGIAEARDPVVETEFQVRKAREVIAKLAARPPLVQEKVLKADLRCHVASATKMAPLAASRANGGDVAASVFQLIAEAQPYMGSTPETGNASPATNGSDPIATARRGIDGPGQRLPFHDEIQRAFGSHDISGIRAHVGGPASDASRELGAHAYTHGDDVAFASTPTRRLVAHEAAHVVQQRAGVSLKSIDGGAGDLHEQQADAVADAVERGESAEPILGAIPRGSARGDAVQRKSDGDTAPQTQPQDDGPPTVKAPGAKWHVFSQNNLPYLILSSQPPVRFWTVSDWIRAGAGFEAHGNHARSPACAAELIRALGWVPEERIEFAAKNIVFDISRRVVPSEVSARGFSFLGMPTSTPVVSREGSDLVVVATRVDDVPAGAHVEPDDGQRQQVIHALAVFTGLAPAPNALDSLRNDPRARDLVVQSGVILWPITTQTGNGVFGFDETSDSEGPYTRWLRKKQDKKPKKQDAKKLKLHDYYGEPIPGALNPNRKLVEAGQVIWLRVDVAWPKHYPKATEFDVVPMVTPGHDGDVALLKCAWNIELVEKAAARRGHRPARPAQARRPQPPWRRPPRRRVALPPRSPLRAARRRPPRSRAAPSRTRLSPSTRTGSRCRGGRPRARSS
jgi:hypothetical protein